MPRLYFALALCAAQGCFTTSVLSASFDCVTEAQYADEVAICHSPQLSTLDEEMAQKYKAAKSASSEPSSLQSEQRQRLSERRRCGSDTQCLLGWYLRIIGILDAPKSALADSKRDDSKPTCQRDCLTMNSICREHGAPSDDIIRGWETRGVNVDYMWKEQSQRYELCHRSVQNCMRSCLERNYPDFPLP